MYEPTTTPRQDTATSTIPTVPGSVAAPTLPRSDRWATGEDPIGPQGPTPPSDAPPDAPPPGGRFGMKHLVATAAVGALLGAGVAIPVGQISARDAVSDLAASQSGQSGDAEPASGPLLFDAGESMTAAIAQRVLPSVVRIDQRGELGGGLGSGVIWSADGYILTNAHVVAGAQQVRVTLPDGTEHDAQVIGSDAPSDIAVLKIEASDLPVPALADEEPAIGETAVAIGSPYGLDGSVTAGIVSSLNRRVSTQGGPLVDLIQTDAAINAGNSGGALVNGSGEVMGINTAILSRSGGNDGIGFAIPISTASRVAGQLIEHGEVRHAYLGIAGRTVDADIAELYGLAATEGVVVEEVVTGEAAAAAGLQRGDIITSMAGQEVTSMEDLLAIIGGLSPGDEVELVWLRGGDQNQAFVTLGDTTR